MVKIARHYITSSTGGGGVAAGAVEKRGGGQLYLRGRGEKLRTIKSGEKDISRPKEKRENGWVGGGWFFRKEGAGCGEGSEGEFGR